MKSYPTDLLEIMLQNFAKSLLDVADNLGRASSVVKESFSKIDTSKDSTGAAPLLKTLLEGVEMTEKQLTEVKDIIFYCKTPLNLLSDCRWRLFSFYLF